MFQFLSGVRRELYNITWADRKQVALTTVMVVIMVVIMAVYFLLLDSFFSWLVKFILKSVG